MSTVDPPRFEERHLTLISIIGDVFARFDQWPLYPYVEATLDHDHGLAFDDVIADMAPRSVWSSSGWGPQAEVQASVAALAAVDALQDDLERFLSLVRLIADAERGHVPSPVDLESSSLRIEPAAIQTASMPEGPDQRALTRLLHLAHAENVAFLSGTREAEWWLSADTKSIRRYRDVRSVNEYIARRPIPQVASHVAFAHAALAPSIFIAMPFRPEWSNNVNDMIRQACSEVAQTVKDLTWRRADDISEPGRITDQIISAIETADLIIADLTGKNPNVMFELGYADAAHKPIVLLNQDDVDSTPFDIKDWRQISYHAGDLGAAREQLVTFIRGALNARSRRTPG